MAGNTTKYAKRGLGIAFVVIGVGADLLGIAGTIAGWGDETTVAFAAAPGSATTTSSAPADETTTTSEPANATTTPPPSETPEEFLDALGAALASADADFLVARLHPEVITRYGEEQCRPYVVAIQDPTAAFEVQSVSDPETYLWVTDGVETEIPDTLSVDVIRTIDGQGTSVTVHVTDVDGQFHWFSDCGDPI